MTAVNVRVRHQAYLVIAKFADIKSSLPMPVPRAVIKA
jgi:hypothetical protein